MKLLLNFETQGGFSNFVYCNLQLYSTHYIKFRNKTKKIRRKAYKSCARTCMAPPDL